MSEEYIQQQLTSKKNIDKEKTFREEVYEYSDLFCRILLIHFLSEFIHTFFFTKDSRNIFSNVFFYFLIVSPFVYLVKYKFAYAIVFAILNFLFFILFGEFVFNCSRCEEYYDL